VNNGEALVRALALIEKKGEKDNIGEDVITPAIATWAAATFCATEDNDRIVPAA